MSSCHPDQHIDDVIDRCPLCGEKSFKEGQGHFCHASDRCRFYPDKNYSKRCTNDPTVNGYCVEHGGVTVIAASEVLEGYRAAIAGWDRFPDVRDEARVVEDGECPVCHGE